MIRYHNLIYRGFQLGYGKRQGGYFAAWRSSFDQSWHESRLLRPTVEQTVALAQACIDFDYQLAAKEAFEGRRLTITELKEIMKP